jgi:signal transduction histidine kinase
MQHQLLISNTKSPIKKIVAVIIAGFLMQTGYFFYFQSKTFSEEAEKTVLQRLSGIANSVAMQIEGPAHEDMMLMYGIKDAITRREQDSTYLQIHTILQKNYAAHNLQSPIYTLVYNADQKQFEFGVTSSENPYFRHAYTHFPPQLMNKMHRGGTIPLFKDEFGSWLTAFAPIKNKYGKTIALLMVDEKFDTVLQNIHTNNRSTLQINALILVLLIALLVNFIRAIISKEEKAKQDLKNAYIEKADLNEKLSTSEEKLKEYADKLERSNKELTDFAHIASHDLKAPVRGIASFTQLLEKRNKDKFDDRDREYFGYIKKNAHQSIALIDSLLSYSKIDKNIGDPIPLNVNHCVEIACNNLRTIIDDKNATVDIPKLPILNAHMNLLAPLFQNLINNGIKYNESPNPRIEIGVECLKSNEYIFSVTDNGIGIDAEYKASVFDMFSRLQSSDKYEGSGIGLAFCKRIIDTYQGQIWLESKVGLGSTFFFTLPKATVVANVQKEALQYA